MIRNILIMMLFTYSGLFAQQKWHGFKIKEFEFDGAKAKIVFPHNADEKKNWIWRARFWDHEPQVDIALLENGFHLVYIDVSDLYGSPKAVNRWDKFYIYIRRQFQLNKKVSLEGLSRGGIIVYNWSFKNIDKVACIYADAPVLDIKSWPGGKGKSPGSKGDWEKCLKAYGLTEETVKEFNGIPLNYSEKFANSKIPIIHVCGLDDALVPIEENTYLFKKKLEKAGGHMELIGKEGVGHHPHSLKDPTPIVSFILKNTQ